MSSSAEALYGGVGAPYPNPVLPGFNPDPSIALVDGVYYIVTSTFEYLPGLPVYRSTDFVEWEQIGNVATREDQLGIGDAPTNMGVWAPTLRWHDGLFRVIVGVPSGRGCIVFTAEDPSGPWSDGVVLEGLNGIDPGLAWDDDGTALVTFSGLILSGPETGKHLGIQQVRADLATGELLSEPGDVWSGSGSMFPEAPHLFRRGDDWYLLIAEGGTERGHGASIGRGTSPQGPFEPGPANPFLSARSTIRPIQNTGHGDFVEGPNGESLFVMLGVRPKGGTRAFSPLGRETFVTRVDWSSGWPVAEPVNLAPRREIVEDVAFDAPLDNRWIAMRRLPQTIATVADGRLTIASDGTTLDDLRAAFVGRRQLALEVEASTTIDVSAGTGGRSLSAETAASFTGRVIGLYAASGTVSFDGFRTVGREHAPAATFGSTSSDA
ncbi:glycoside hydrolase family 43 protein [Microbacterium indicum]|uniref:glycoside hydrolase family 43 protein n=1 Tax=Microbacterium indicum TaxID=358100 RepID=UPI00041A3B75|nr:glycoside hydrolase family 43 protein [Microbacterium indicum]